jgi:tRNA pseudouridine32 synthase / 23S rRNA pseudouridine746 synthase
MLTAEDKPLVAVAVLAVTADLIAVDKPAGLPSVPGRKPELLDCVWHRLQATHPEARVVHRLDMATSGVMIFARHHAAQVAVSRSFEQRAIRKHYVALVEGWVSADDGLIDAPIAADWINRPRQLIDIQRGREAITAWQVIHRGRQHGLNVTLLNLQPHTGRSHQLRVHMRHIGHPIVGDALYGHTPADHASTTLHLHAARIESPVHAWCFESTLPAWAHPRPCVDAKESEAC